MLEPCRRALPQSLATRVPRELEIGIHDENRPWKGRFTQWVTDEPVSTMGSRFDGVIPSTMSVIYKIVPGSLWRKAEERGTFDGAPVDVADGFIHFSSAGQVAETAARHFASQGGLLLVAVSTKPLGDALRWEPSRGGALFPHLYAPLPLSAVLWVKPLPLGLAGRHDFPALED